MSGLPTALVTIDVSAAALLVMIVHTFGNAADLVELLVHTVEGDLRSREEGNRALAGLADRQGCLVKGVPELEQWDGQEEDEQNERTGRDERRDFPTGHR